MGSSVPPDDRLLRVESAIVDIRRRLWLALAGYIILALGLIAAFIVAQNTLEKAEETQHKLTKIAGGYCQAFAADTRREENAVVDQMLAGEKVEFGENCLRIIRGVRR
jgi:hypothetical protein